MPIKEVKVEKKLKNCRSLGPLETEGSFPDPYFFTPLSTTTPLIHLIIVEKMQKITTAKCLVIASFALL